MAFELWIVCTNLFISIYFKPALWIVRYYINILSKLHALVVGSLYLNTFLFKHIPLKKKFKQENLLKTVVDFGEYINKCSFLLS